MEKERCRDEVQCIGGLWTLDLCIYTFLAAALMHRDPRRQPSMMSIVPACEGGKRCTDLLEGDGAEGEHGCTCFLWRRMAVRNYTAEQSAPFMIEWEQWGGDLHTAAFHTDTPVLW